MSAPLNFVGFWPEISRIAWGWGTASAKSFQNMTEVVWQHTAAQFLYSS